MEGFDDGWDSTWRLVRCTDGARSDDLNVGRGIGGYERGSTIFLFLFLHVFTISAMEFSDYGCPVRHVATPLSAIVIQALRRKSREPGPSLHCPVAKDGSAVVCACSCSGVREAERRCRSVEGAGI